MSYTWKRVAPPIVLFVVLFIGTTEALQRYGIQNLCNGVLEVKGPPWGTDSSVLLAPTADSTVYNYDVYEKDRDCSLVVKPHSPLYELVVSVRTLDLRPYGADELTIWHQEGFGGRVVFRNSNSYTNRKYDAMESKYYTSSNLNISFSTTRGMNTQPFEGFELVITAVRHGPCHNNEFLCTNGLCIASEFKCDGHNHCGDRSEQQNCETETMSGNAILVIVLAVVHVLVAVVIGAFLARKKCKWEWWKKPKDCPYTVTYNPSSETEGAEISYPSNNYIWEAERAATEALAAEAKIVTGGDVAVDTNRKY